MRVEGSGFRVEGSGFGVEGGGCRTNLLLLADLLLDLQLVVLQRPLLPVFATLASNYLFEHRISYLSIELAIA